MKILAHVQTLKIKYLVALGAATLGLLHFAGVLFAWMCALIPADLASGYVWRYLLVHAWPIPLLITATALSSRFAWKQRPVAFVMQVAAILGSAALLAFDFHYGRWQVQSMTVGHGCRHMYCNWPEFSDDLFPG